MSEEIKVVEEKTAPFAFSNKKGTLELSLYLRLNEKGIWDAFTEGEYLFLDEEDKEGLEHHAVEFVRPWWRLSVQVDDLSSDINDIGMKITNVSKSIDNTLKYYMKKLSFFELEFEKDLDGFDKVSDKCWSKLSNQDGLAPQIIACLYRTYKEISDI